ncbi:hypothetical protein L1987_36273 [Smallanthus sonchifolius]|uniref:Uncharacterized protein n=1 Tax=Smallanthus sonchifolius TaxID=185202 RepID=A0ACB9HEC4_9ASTR|nr:hypothetical protein L1987_36273 [Smallanthus sonchifolius]
MLWSQRPYEAADRPTAARKGTAVILNRDPRMKVEIRDSNTKTKVESEPGNAKLLNSSELNSGKKERKALSGTQAECSYYTTVGTIASITEQKDTKFSFRSATNPLSHTTQTHETPKPPPSLQNPPLHSEGRTTMNGSNKNPTHSSSVSSMAAPPDSSGKKVRKPYTITKSRESWTDEEHDKFLEALQLFDRDWKKIEDFVGSKTVIQIRSHAQKYFLKVQKNGSIAHVPPPRPKRKATHPYPQKAAKNVLLPLQTSMCYPSSMSALAPGYSPWDDTCQLISPSGGIITSHDEYDLHGIEGMHASDAGSRGAVKISNISNRGIGSSSREIPGSELSKQGEQGIPNFSEVYSFIGSVFDPESKGHVQKLKEMDPINFETVLLLMRNLTVNLSSPDFEQMRKVLSSYDVNSKTIGVSAGNVYEPSEQRDYCVEL